MKLRDNKAGIEKRRKIIMHYAERCTHKSTLFKKIIEITNVSERTVYRDIKNIDKFDSLR